jgi:CubicO group peptidase (beta-lactamase class C family)
VIVYNFARASDNRRHVSTIDRTNLEAIVANAMAVSGAVGAQVTLVDGATATDVASGLANVELGTPMSVDTVMQVGSFAKMLTATLVHRLVDEGRLELDRPVVSWLPELKLSRPSATAALLPRHLLSMTSGLDFGQYYDFGAGPDALRRYVETLADQPMLFEPGEAFAYSGSSTVISGRLLEQATGRMWSALVGADLLATAGLDHTIVDPLELPYHRVAAGHAVDKDGSGTVLRPWLHVPATAPNGSTLMSCAGDLARFAAMLVRDGIALNGARVLSADAVAQMHQPQVALRAEMIADRWCLGPYVRSVGAVASDPARPLAIYGHGGRWQGGVCDVVWVPARGLVLATATNTPNRAGAFIQAVCAAVLPTYLGSAAWVTPIPARNLPLDTERWLGRYESASSEFLVEAAGDALRLTVQRHAWPGTAFTLGGGQVDLYPIGEGRFLPIEETPVERRLQEVWFTLDGPRAEFIYDGLIGARRVS